MPDRGAGQRSGAYVINARRTSRMYAAEELLNFLNRRSWIAPLLAYGWEGSLHERSALPFVPSADRPAALAPKFEACFEQYRVRAVLL